MFHDTVQEFEADFGVITRRLAQTRDVKTLATDPTLSMAEFVFLSLKF